MDDGLHRVVHVTYHPVGDYQQDVVVTSSSISLGLRGKLGDMVDDG